MPYNVRFHICDVGLDVIKLVTDDTARSVGTAVNASTRLLAGTRFSPLTILLANEGRLGRKSGHIPVLKSLTKGKTDRFFSGLVFSSFHYFFQFLLSCGRLSWLPAIFWAHTVLHCIILY